MSAGDNGLLVGDGVESDLFVAESAEVEGTPQAAEGATDFFFDCDTGTEELAEESSTRGIDFFFLSVANLVLISSNVLEQKVSISWLCGFSAFRALGCLYVETLRRTKSCSFRQSSQLSHFRQEEHLLLG